MPGLKTKRLKHFDRFAFHQKMMDAILMLAIGAISGIVLWAVGSLK